MRGIPVSEGVCRDRIIVLGKPHDAIPRHDISEADLPQEIQRLERALTQTRRQILEVQRKVANALGAKDASIFDAHLLVLDDPTLIDEVNRVIHHQKVNVEYAFQQVAEKYASTLSTMNDEYLRERAADMRDVTTRVLDNLLGRADEAGVRKLKEPCIIIAYDLSPSTTALLDKKLVRGFATDIGSKTSHTAIMARSLEIPAVVGLHDASRQLQTGPNSRANGSPSKKNCATSATSQPSPSTAFASRFRRTSSRRLTPSMCAPAARRAWGYSARNIFSSTARRCRTKRSNTGLTAR